MNNVQSKKMQRTAKNKSKNAVKRKIDRIVKRVKNVELESSAINDKFIDGNPVANRKIPNSVRELQHYNRVQKKKYLTGLLHPDVAVREGYKLKLYSDLPIPTATVAFHEQKQFTTSANGLFLLSWRPQYLDTTSNNFNTNVTFNNTAGLTGNAGSTGNAFRGTSYNLTTPIQRYRLVSALCKVSYNGSVLNQSGTMVSCATFDPFGVATDGQTDSLVDRFGNFSTIVNGLWAQTTQITQHAEGLECLFVPMDPDDLIFQRSGTFFGTAVSSAGTIVGPDFEGAHINYVVGGRNLPITSACILVDFYYNFEVIPDPVSVPVLCPSVDDSWSKNDSAMVMIGDYAKKGGLIRKSQPASNSTWSDILGTALDLGIKYIPKFFAAAM